MNLLLSMINIVVHLHLNMDSYNNNQLIDCIEDLYNPVHNNRDNSMENLCMFHKDHRVMMNIDQKVSHNFDQYNQIDIDKYKMDW